MPPRKLALDAAGDGEPTAKRRSSRQATAAATASAATAQHKAATASAKAVPTTTTARKQQEKKKQPASKDPTPATKPKGRVATKAKAKAKVKSGGAPKAEAEDKDEAAADIDEAEKRPSASGGRDVTPDPDPASLPVQNPETVRHDGEWYWLMKAEPESRFEGGVDVRFSIDDLRACTKPEGWDGELFPYHCPWGERHWFASWLTRRNRNQELCRFVVIPRSKCSDDQRLTPQLARNNLRAMNAGDKAFFYHSNCKTPGIVGTMEIVREHSEDSKPSPSPSPSPPLPLHQNPPPIIS